MCNYIKEYVRDINDLPVSNKYIFGILPSHIKTTYFKQSLIIYHVFNDDNINLISDNDDIDIISRNKRILILNNIIREECLKYNINYCDIYDLITDNYVLNDIFYLKNPYNIHQKYEYLLFIYLFNCLCDFKNKINIKLLIKQLKKEYNTYLKQSIMRSIDKNVYNKEMYKEVYNKNKFHKNEIIRYINNLIKLKKLSN